MEESLKTVLSKISATAKEEFEQRLETTKRDEHLQELKEFKAYLDWQEAQEGWDD